MTKQDLIDLMESDATISIKDFTNMHNKYVTCMIANKQCYNPNQFEYMVAYVEFLEKHFRENL